MFRTLLAAAEGGTLELTLTPQMLAIIPLLAVAMQMLKGLQPLQKLKPWFPLLSVGVAIGLAILMKMGPDLQGQALAGIVMGLATSGGYDASRVASKVMAAEPTTETPDKAGL